MTELLNTRILDLRYRKIRLKQICMGDLVPRFPREWIIRRIRAIRFTDAKVLVGLEDKSWQRLLVLLRAMVLYMLFWNTQHLPINFETLNIVAWSSFDIIPWYKELSKACLDLQREDGGRAVVRHVVVVRRLSADHLEFQALVRFRRYGDVAVRHGGHIDPRVAFCDGFRDVEFRFQDAGVCQRRRFGA